MYKSLPSIGRTSGKNTSKPRASGVFSMGFNIKRPGPCDPAGDFRRALDLTITSFPAEVFAPFVCAIGLNRARDLIEPDVVTMWTEHDVPHGLFFGPSSSGPVVI